MKRYQGQEARRVHEFLQMADERDESLEIERKRRLRSALSHALRPYHAGQPNYHGRVKFWVNRKLDALLALGMINQKPLPVRARLITELHFKEGIPILGIAHQLKLSKRQVYRDIRYVLDAVIERAPASLIKMLDLVISRFIVDGCNHCGGDLEWDSEGAHIDNEGEYRCLQCARRFTYDLIPVEIAQQKEDD